MFEVIGKAGLRLENKPTQEQTRQILKHNLEFLANTCYFVILSSINLLGCRNYLLSSTKDDKIASG